MWRLHFMLLVAALIAVSGLAVADTLFTKVASGELMRPEVGAFSWYDVTDSQTKQKLFMRQAVVGEKKVGVKTGYWLETEIIPHVGFPMVYKILLTGAATDPKNVHEIFAREGNNPPTKVSLNEGGAPMPASGLKDAAAQSLGKEKITLQEGEIEAEHFVVGEGEKKTDIWISEEIAPMGIVKMVSSDGEMVLRRHGKGGQDAESVIDRTIEGAGTTENTKVTVKVDKDKAEKDKVEEPTKKNFSKKAAE